MRGIILKGFLTLALTAVGIAFAADPIEIDLTPIFDLGSSATGVTPVRVEISNTGPEAKGMLRASSGNDFAMYPVNLPTGAKQVFYTYIQSGWRGQHYVLSTDQGQLVRDVSPRPSDSPSAESQTNSVALVGDVPGALSAITRSHRGPTGGTLADSYVRTEFAPDRAVGYQSMSGVLLGEGTERLGDDRIRALRQYVLAGGTLIFVGGSSHATISDPRWADLLPASGFRAVAVASSAKLNELAQEKVQGPITLAIGKPIAGASTIGDPKSPVMFERPWGFGRVIVFTFNPFEPPLEHDPALVSILSSVVQRTKTPKVESFGNPAGLDVPAMGYGSVRQDPFSMRLPSTERILEVLAGYFLVVVPLNFLILRKAKRGEFAWFTAPILSLAFAGILFKSAQSLYSAKLSTASQGVLIGQAGSPEAVFVGGSQMFIPSGGYYDLKMRGVDSLTVVDNRESLMGTPARTSNAFELQPIDVGEIRVPHMRADNLAFRELYYRQHFDSTNWFDVRRTGRNKVKVTNGSPYALTDAALVHGYYREEIGELPRGKSKTIAVNEGNGDVGLFNNGDIRNWTGPSGRAALTGSMVDFRPGPQIGKVIDDRTRITLAYFVDGSVR